MKSMTNENSIYQQLLRYYLTSDTYFLEILDSASVWMLLQNGYCGEKEFTFETKFYRSCRERFQQEGGIHISMPDEVIKEYFEKYTIGGWYRLPAVLLAHWLGLSKQQIGSIKRSKWYDLSSLDKLLQYNAPQSEQYIICTDKGEVNATIGAGKDYPFLVTESGEEYEIVL